MLKFHELVSFDAVVIFLDCFYADDVVREGHVFWVSFDGLAAMLVDKGPSRCTYCELPADVVDGEEEGGTDETLDEAWKEIRDSHCGGWRQRREGVCSLVQCTESFKADRLQ